MLSAREEHAQCVGKAGDPARAVRLLAALLADTETLNEPGSVLLLGIRRSLAEWTGQTGHSAQAARLLRALLDDVVKQRGDNDPRVKILQRRLNHWTATAGSSTAGITTPGSHQARAPAAPQEGTE